MENAAGAVNLARSLGQSGVILDLRSEVERQQEVISRLEVEIDRELAVVWEQISELRAKVAQFGPREAA